MVRGRPPLTYTTQQHQSASLFELERETPAVGSDGSLSGTQLIPGLLEGWNALRDAGIKPLFSSRLDGDVSRRSEFLEGCYAMGLVGKGRELKPQQLRVADVCNAGHTAVAVLLPRRSTKTTSLFALALGRCFSRPGYQVAYAACTTGLKARGRFRKDIVSELRRQWPDEASRPFKIYMSGGAERIEFDNGSVFEVFPPEGEKFRSDAYDLIILDEAGEASPAMGEDLLAGVLPTFDTRPDAQLIVAGTAANYRAGNLLWDYLVGGREKTNGIIEYAAPDSTTEEELNDWATVKKLALKAHPGVNTLTTLKVIQERWEKLSRARFAAEYLGIFGTAGAIQGLADFPAWEKGGNDGPLPKAPARFGLGYAVHPNQTSASIVAAWRVRKKVRLLLLDYRQNLDRNVGPVTVESARLAIKYRTPIVHDTNGPVTVEVEALDRMRPKPRRAPQRFPDIKTAAALIIKEIALGNVEHYNQTQLTEAVRIAVKRSVGPSAWALGRRNEDDDITPLEAAAMALRAYDATEGRKVLLPPEDA